MEFQFNSCYVDVFPNSWKPLVQDFNFTKIHDIMLQTKTPFVDLIEPFKYCNPNQVKLIILNKQPSPSFLAWSSKEVNNNIKVFVEIIKNTYHEKDFKVEYSNIKYYLSHWSKQGVLLMNISWLYNKTPSSLNTSPWIELTKHILSKLYSLDTFIISLAFGKEIYDFYDSIKGHKLIMKSTHPFVCYKNNTFDEDIISKINDTLLENGRLPIVFETIYL